MLSLIRCNSTSQKIYVIYRDGFEVIYGANNIGIGRDDDGEVEVTRTNEVRNTIKEYVGECVCRIFFTAFTLLQILVGSFIMLWV